MTQEPEQFQKYLDCSTKHISLEDSKWLQEPPDELVVYSNEYGWFVHAPCDLDEGEFVELLDSMGMGPGLMGVLQYARQHDCIWVKLDCDGTEIDELPSFDW